MIVFSILQNYIILTFSICTILQGNEGYGKRDPTCTLTEEESRLLDIAKIDETVLINKQIKLMISFGSLMGFYGSDEHMYMKWHKIGTGHFPPDHPKWPNVEWWGLTCFLQDKASKLNTKNDFVREMSEALDRFPVLSDGIKGDVSHDFGGAIKR